MMCDWYSKLMQLDFELLTKGCKEAAAHFANLYVSRTYPNAINFIARDCSILTMSLIIYVKGIK